MDSYTLLFGMPLRTLARICVGLFALSAAFPVVAGALNRPYPILWLGIADVVVAAALFLAAAILASRARDAVTDRHRLAAFRPTQWVAALIPILLVAFFFAGPRLDWTVLVIGLAWRAWLLLYTLPFLAVGLESE